VITPESMVELRFRHMKLEDVEQVYAIDVLSFPLPWSERSYRYELSENQNSRAWVAEAVDERGRTQVVGMIVVWIILDEAHIATFAILPEFRRMHIGQRLLALTLNDALKSGVTQAYLEVRRNNLAAQNMYRKFGFVVNGVRPRYYLDNSEDALLMILTPIQIETFRQFGGKDLSGDEGSH
jgi:ribosomal-protein-alanine N-acetyltransferase